MSERREHRQRHGAIVATVGAGVALIGTFLPWLRSGARDRSSYTIFDLVERLGFSPDGPVSWALRVWPLVPLLLVLDAVAVWIVVHNGAKRHLLVGATALTVLWLAGTSIAVWLAPEMGLFRIGIGPAVTLAGVLAFALGVALISPRGSGSSAAS